LEIVGVARDIQDHSFWLKPIRRFYVSYFQPIDGITTANFAIRTEENPGIFAATLRREVRSADPRLMVQNIRDLNSLMDQSLVQTRMLTHLSASFGLLAVLLAVIGLYGVVSHEVVQRTGEIGIRMALGARRRDVLFLFLGNSLKVIAVGLALGTALAFALARVLRTFLFEVEPTDPATFAGVAILFTAVALLACYIPARRATKVDPMTVLRYE
jgi:ABC-type lipoprotein release transport system permease subunit